MKKSYFSNANKHTAVLLALVAFSFFFYAYSGGITGQTRKPGSGNGCTCHGASPTTGVTVSITGPDTLAPNQVGNYTVRISGGPLASAGTNIAVSSGTLIAGTTSQLISNELTHQSPQAPVAGVVTYAFTYRAPASTGSAIMYANGNSVDLSGGSDGDQWNFAPNKTITIMQPVPVELTSFTASANGSSVSLTWITATETNNRGFQIEKKSTSGDWSIAGFVAGNGTTTSEKVYTFTENNVAAGTYNYRLKQMDFDGSNKYHLLKGNVEVGLPAEFSLGQNYPNPFNPSTNIAFRLPVDGSVTLALYSITGKEISTLIRGYRESGSYLEQYNASELAAGVYFYKLTVTEPATGKLLYAGVKKMILNK